MHVPARGLLVLAILATACGGGTAASSAPGRTINVDMAEFTYSPMSITVKAGETVTIRLKNTGTIEHEFMAGRRAVAGVGYSEDWLALAKSDRVGGHDMNHQGRGVRVQPRGSTAFTLTIPAETGEFEFGCFMPGHYEAGMKGKLVVA